MGDGVLAESRRLQRSLCQGKGLSYDELCRSYLVFRVPNLDRMTHPDNLATLILRRYFEVLVSSSGQFNNRTITIYPFSAHHINGLWLCCDRHCCLYAGLCQNSTSEADQWKSCAPYILRCVDLLTQQSGDAIDPGVQLKSALARLGKAMRED